MNFDKYTQQSQESIQSALNIAGDLQHQQIEPQHLTLSLLKTFRASLANPGRIPAAAAGAVFSPEIS